MRRPATQVDPPLILAAIDLHQLSLWDALMLWAASAAGCRELLSKDMQQLSIASGEVEARWRSCLYVNVRS